MVPLQRGYVPARPTGITAATGGAFSHGYSHYGWFPFVPRDVANTEQDYSSGGGTLLDACYVRGAPVLS